MVHEPKAPLFQSYRREIAGGGFVQRDLLMHPQFSVTLVRGSRIVLDYGLQAELVQYIPRLRELRRSQLSILLAGRGYFGIGDRFVDLSPGDIVSSDQSKLEPEGYTGSPFEVLIIAWQDDLFFGPRVVGDTRAGRLVAADVAALRAHTATEMSAGSHRWLAGLLERLRALGLPAASDVSCGPGDPSTPLSRVCRALGDALCRLDSQPSLLEIAEACALTERHVHRMLQELERSYGYPFSGWRDLVHDTRLAWATALLSVPSVSVVEAAAVAGYRSPVALVHAFSSRCGATPGKVARRLRERWDP